jgi:hypothetical protein
MDDAVKQPFSILTRICSIQQHIMSLVLPALFWTHDYNLGLQVFQSGNQSRLVIYVGHSPSHAGSVALVLNPCTGHVSPQFHVVFDDLNSTVPYMEKSEVPPNWANLLENSREKVTEEDYNLAKMWPFPEAEIGDITMQDTINTTTTQTPAKENTSNLVPSAVPFESRPLSNSGTFESTTTTGLSENNDSIPCLSLNLVTTLTPSSMIDDSLSAPPLINLETSGLC